MIPVEPINVINRRLWDWFGSTNNRPNYKLVWSDTEFEHRATSFSDGGVELLYPEVRLLPKYKQYIQSKWVLERLTVVPVLQQTELPIDKLSYEPIWVFGMTPQEEAQPAWMACKFIIETINRQIEQAGSYVKYKHPYAGLTTPQQIEKKHEEIKDIQDALFVNETPIGDALAHGYGVGFTTSKIKET